MLCTVDRAGVVKASTYLRSRLISPAPRETPSPRARQPTPPRVGWRYCVPLHLPPGADPPKPQGPVPGPVTVHTSLDGPLPRDRCLPGLPVSASLDVVSLGTASAKAELSPLGAGRAADPPASRPWLQPPPAPSAPLMGPSEALDPSGRGPFPRAPAPGQSDGPPQELGALRNATPGKGRAEAPTSEAPAAEPTPPGPAPEAVQCLVAPPWEAPAAPLMGAAAETGAGGRCEPRRRSSPRRIGAPNNRTSSAAATGGDGGALQLPASARHEAWQRVARRFWAQHLPVIMDLFRAEQADREFIRGLFVEAELRISAACAVPRPRRAAPSAPAAPSKRLRQLLAHCVLLEREYRAALRRDESAARRSYLCWCETGVREDVRKAERAARATLAAQLRACRPGRTPRVKDVMTAPADTQGLAAESGAKAGTAMASAASQPKVPGGGGGALLEAVVADYRRRLSAALLDYCAASLEVREEAGRADVARTQALEWSSMRGGLARLDKRWGKLPAGDRRGCYCAPPWRCLHHSSSSDAGMSSGGGSGASRPGSDMYLSFSSIPVTRQSPPSGPAPDFWSPWSASQSWTGVSPARRASLREDGLNGSASPQTWEPGMPSEDVPFADDWQPVALGDDDVCLVDGKWMAAGPAVGDGDSVELWRRESF